MERSNYVVLRVFPKAVFWEHIGNKKSCIEYTKKAAKPLLRICKMVPVVKWDRRGKAVKMK